MNLNGIGNSLGGLRPSQIDPRTRSIQQDRAPAAPVERMQPQAVRPAMAQPAGGVPVEAPAGTDPELWAVLTAEERNFFAKVGSMGPLTYGYVMQTGRLPNEMPAARGGRLDVKV